MNNLSKLKHNERIEIIWTIFPTIILWIIGLPSLKLLYMMDEILDPEITIKVKGNQWYWNYSYGDYEEEISYDSYMISDEDLNKGELRKLTVDNYLILPINTSIRFIITSSDVLHSFSIPAFGIKMDAVPGRLNSVGVIINRLSTYYGQCSEHCGINHSNMPIGIKSVLPIEYLYYIKSQLN